MFLVGFRVQYKTGSSNGKIRSFLVWILIRKDSTDNEIFKEEFFVEKKQVRKG